MNAAGGLGIVKTDCERKTLQMIGTEDCYAGAIVSCKG